jgi:5'-3' exonuclease
VFVLFVLQTIALSTYNPAPSDNSISHPAAENYDKYHALLHKRLDAIMRLTNPRKSVMLAIDGPAPLAKLITQRDRRKVR